MRAFSSTEGLRTRKKRTASRRRQSAKVTHQGLQQQYRTIHSTDEMTVEITALA
jgi:hypothetical protein